jgi:hypothetical protein
MCWWQGSMLPVVWTSGTEACAAMAASWRSCCVCELLWFQSIHFGGTSAFLQAALHAVTTQNGCSQENAQRNDMGILLC